MGHMLHVRAAKREEMEWVNACYDEVEFVHSNFERETIAIAEWNSQKAGLGRLVKLDSKNLELGGMYVFEAFRGKGIAKEIVLFLLAQAQTSQTIYCIPFAKLTTFYHQFGFLPCQELGVPEKIVSKYRWCQETYREPTELLKYVCP